MPSQALQYWQQDCQQRLDELLNLHISAGGSRPGRRHGLEQLNWAMVLKLAAEWQDFCRNLYAEVADLWLDHAAGDNQDLRENLEFLVTRNLKMERGSADPSSLNDDFLQLGLNAIQELKSHHHLNAHRLEHLRSLHHARNAIAHNDPQKLTEMGTSGRVHKKHVLSWRQAADQLARELDAVTSNHLTGMFRSLHPW